MTFYIFNVNCPLAPKEGTMKLSLVILTIVVGGTLGGFGAPFLISLGFSLLPALGILCLIGAFVGIAIGEVHYRVFPR